jgi:hypothetical protein
VMFGGYVGVVFVSCHISLLIRDYPSYTALERR